MKVKTIKWINAERLRLYRERMFWQALMRQDWKRYAYWTGQLTKSGH
jgi:hypothetical protein